MRNLLLINVFLLFVFIGYAGQVDSVRAKYIAANFFLQKGNNISTNTLRIVPLKSKLYSKLKTTSQTVNALYIIEKEGSGFVIISGYDNVQPILGYSFDTNYNPNNMPPALKEWISWREAEIGFIVNSKQKAGKEISNQWGKLESGQIAGAIEDYREPLIKTYWGQGVYYNDSCPVDVNSDYANNKVPTGCVATAMAQIMKFWEYPASGTNSHSYTPASHPEYGIQSTKYSTATYNWPVMSTYALHADSGKTAITEISKIIYHCGVSVNMDYDPDGSSANTSSAVNSLKNYFKYKSTASFINRANYTNETWNNVIRNEIINFRPVLLRGSASDNTGGHAYVCDGYYGTEYFHINWGWNGSYNGYFSFTCLTPGGSNDFSYYQYAGIGIVPSTSSCAIYPYAVSLSSVSGSSSQFSINSNTTWTISDDQTWLDVATTSGTGYSKIIISANSANTTGANRIATIIVTANGLAAKTIKVTQLAASAALANLYPYKPSGWSNKLVISKVKGTVIDDEITENDTIYLDYSFINAGNANVSNVFSTWLLLDDVVFREPLRTSTLAPTYYLYTRDFMIGRLSAGTHTLSIKVDALNDILESNETDNIYTRTFEVTAATKTLEIADANPDFIQINPNPVVDMLNIQFGKANNKTMKIFNSGGACITQMEVTGDKVKIPASTIPQGVYILQVLTSNGIASTKFIKQ